ncbi:MAG: methyltransferase [Chitinophagaceae bacterium]|nr:methyltransferase [Chitinophagaceae bacterium]
MLPLLLQPYLLASTQLEIYVPDTEAVQKAYSNNKDAAYWAQVWPASIGLCNFLQGHPQYIEGKNILELAAGLGLPGLYAAGTAKQVIITDREEQAVACMQQSIAHLQLKNTHAVVMHWKDAMQASLPDVLLLSDVSYEPAVFDELLSVLEYFLQNKVTIIISTPQRLAAKPFINSLLPYCIQQWNCGILLNAKETGVSVFVLGQ